MQKHTMAITRAVAVIGSTVALVAGITFANGLQSTATLSDTTIDTATANLQVWDGAVFAASGPGFTVTGLVPGTGKEYPFYFKNAGDVDLDLSVTVPTTPSASGFTGWENLKVTITDDESGQVTDTNMQDLLAGNVVLNDNSLSAGATGNGGVANTEGNYHIKFDIDPSAISGSQATVGAFNLIFTGTQPSVE